MRTPQEFRRQEGCKSRIHIVRHGPYFILERVFLDAKGVQESVAELHRSMDEQEADEFFDTYAAREASLRERTG